MDIFGISHIFGHFFWILEALNVVRTWYFGSQLVDIYNIRYTILILACGRSAHQDFLAQNTSKIDIFGIFTYLVTFSLLETLNVVCTWYFGSQMIDIYNIRYTILILACGRSAHQDFLAKNTPKMDICGIFHIFGHLFGF